MARGAEEEGAEGGGGGAGAGGAGLEVEGVVHDGGLLLRCLRSGAVFAPERGPGGELVRVGRWDAERGAVELEEPGAPPAPAPAGPCAPGAAAPAAARPAPRHAFEAAPEDHCESPPEAYADIAPVLCWLAGRLGRRKHGPGGKGRARLRVWDPYFCDGAVARHLGSQGFPRVHNENEDFYTVLREGREPRHDVVVTNPPYSGDHVARLLEFCRASRKPWLLLMPNYVYTRPEFARALQRPDSGRADLAFLAPPKRYVYWTPKALGAGRHSNSGPLGVRTSPFASFWYVHLGRHHGEFLEWWAREQAAAGGHRCTLARTPAELPFAVLDQADPLRRKLRDRKRALERQRGGRGGAKKSRRR